MPIPSSHGSYDLLTFYTGCSRLGVHLVTAIHTCLPVFTSQICHNSQSELISKCCGLLFIINLCALRKCCSSVRRLCLYLLIHSLIVVVISRLGWSLGRTSRSCSGCCPTAQATFAGHAHRELRLPKPATGWPNRRVLPADRSAGKSGHHVHVRLPHVNGR